MISVEDRIYIYEKNVIYMKDVVQPNLADVNKNIERLKELSAGLDSLCIILDLTETKPPDIEARVAIITFLKSNPKLKYLSVFTEKNFFLNIISQSIFSWSGLENFSFHKTKNQAINALIKLNHL